MRTITKPKLLRLRFGERDRYNRKPLYEAILNLAHPVPEAEQMVDTGIIATTDVEYVRIEDRHRLENETTEKICPLH